MALMTRHEFNARWAALRDAFEYQFTNGPREISMLPGWLPIAETLLRAADKILNAYEKKAFGWTEFKVVCGWLDINFTHRRVLVDRDGRYVGIIEVWDHTYDELVVIADEAREASRSVCGYCGAPGEHRPSGRPDDWLPTLCDACARDRKMFADDERAGS